MYSDPQPAQHRHHNPVKMLHVSSLASRGNLIKQHSKAQSWNHHQPHNTFFFNIFSTKNNCFIENRKALTFVFYPLDLHGSTDHTTRRCSIFTPLSTATTSAFWVWQRRVAPRDVNGFGLCSWLWRVAWAEQSRGFYRVFIVLFIGF